jgi:hypothetical protein
MLENSSYPFATKILESLKRNEEQMAKGLPAEGIPPELMGMIAQQANSLQAPQGTVPDTPQQTTEETARNGETAVSYEDGTLYLV